ncbi:MAG TPA: VWA domain-containing protein [Terriglobales bacterium]|nr:VWA domain-containing protein [Terriglobales bacterium]
MIVRTSARWGGLVVLFLASLSVQAQAPTFRSDVNLINATFSARTPQGTVVSDLRQEEVQVFEDDVPQTIRFFDSSTLPLTIGLIVDVSNSQQRFFRDHRRDLEAFLKDAMRPQDQAFLVCFGNHLRLVSDLTSSISNIIDAYARFERGDRNFPELGPDENRSEGTALFDAIYYSATEKLQTSGRGRRALIVFSDGEDNSSAHDVVDAIDAAQSADILVYSVRYARQRGLVTSRNKYGARVMKRIAHDTGADDFDATNGANLDNTFKQIGAELRTLYTAAYHATNRRRDGTFRRVTVKVSRPDVIVRTKAGYYAKP